MRRSIQPVMAGALLAAICLGAAAVTLSRDGTPVPAVPALAAEVAVPATPAAPPSAMATATPVTMATPASKAVPGSKTTPPSSGMVVARDPETGTLGMPAPGQLAPALSIEEAQAYARQIASELVTEHRADGSSSLKHDPRLADYTVVQIGADGKPVFTCAHGAQACDNALRNHQPGNTPGLEDK